MKILSNKLVVSRNRWFSGLLAIGVMLIGLASRRYFDDVAFIKQYVGDVLWALMVFFSLAFLFPKWPARTVGLLTLLFSFSIELGQLYHAPWIDAIRATRLGGLVLGFTFVWSDLFCYSLGVLIGIGVDGKLTSQTK
ncbi:ribosomal maturation YjgA family protein [Spirosoma aerophilum]